MFNLKISFWNKAERYVLVVDLDKIRLDEILICLAKQYPLEVLK